MIFENCSIDYLLVKEIRESNLSIRQKRLYKLYNKYNPMIYKYFSQLNRSLGISLNQNYKHDYYQDAFLEIMECVEKVNFKKIRDPGNWEISGLLNYRFLTLNTKYFNTIVSTRFCSVDIDNELDCNSNVFYNKERKEKLLNKQKKFKHKKIAIEVDKKENFVDSSSMKTLLYKELRIDLEKFLNKQQRRLLDLFFLEQKNRKELKAIFGRSVWWELDKIEGLIRKNGYKNCKFSNW